MLWVRFKRYIYSGISYHLFRFALVFGEELTTDAKITLSPDRTFEFYPASMMFLAPDSG